MRAAIDTSSSHAAFAVMIDGEDTPIVRLHGIPLGRQSGSLPQQVMKALGTHSIDINAINCWTIGMGPGSFTGIRVGAALVKGICAGSHASYRGIPSSLAMVMASASPTMETVIALHDGRRSEVLVSPYRLTDDAWEADGKPYPLKISELEKIRADCVVMLKGDRALAEVQAVCNALTVLDEFPVEQLILSKPDFLPTDNREQEESCEPVYVRPAVFVEPTLKKRR